VRRHGADSQQLVPDLEQLLQQHLGIVVAVLVGDLLLETSRFLRQRRNEVDLATSQRGHDGVRQLHRRARVDLVLLDAVQHQARVDDCDRGTHGRVQRAVHRHQVVRPDELVELDVVHVTAAAQLGRVHHGEDMIVVKVDLRDVVALDAVAHRELVKAEEVLQHPGVGRQADRNIHPDQRVRLLQQHLQVLSGPLLNARIGDRVHVHAAPALRSRRS
jgi:hypothetical protein